LVTKLSYIRQIRLVRSLCTHTTTTIRMWRCIRSRFVAVVDLCAFPKIRRSVLHRTSLENLHCNTQQSSSYNYDHTTGPAASLTPLLAAALAHDPAKTTADGRMSTMSSTTSAASTANIASSSPSAATLTSASKVRVHVVTVGTGCLHSKLESGPMCRLETSSHSSSTR
jgi:hypothetical protein